MNKNEIQDYKRNMWVQRKLHSLVLDGYYIAHSRVEVQPGVFLWILRHRNGNELHLRQQQNIVSLERNDKIIHIEQF